MSSVRATSPGATGIDDLMDRASEALAACSYFEAESLALRGLRRAFDAKDYERMSRIALPLLEARRQKMQLAQDVGRVTVIDPRVPEITEAGLFLVQPPQIAAEARTMREAADRKGICAVVLAREPMSRAGVRAGKWPIVAVGPTLGGRDHSVRTYVDPPEGVTTTDNGHTRDTLTKPSTVAWMLGACEALGDAALAKLNPADPAADRVEDLLEFIDAWPTHEKLHQRLIEECRHAMTQPTPALERRRGLPENPWSF